MKGNLILVLALTIFSSAFALRAKITRVECKEFDKAFASITICYLKALSRYKSAFSLYVALHQVPVDNVTVRQCNVWKNSNFPFLQFNAALFRKGNNGYRPFMYNHTVDFCRFYKNPNRFMFWKIVFFNIVAPASNINHTCPYDVSGRGSPSRCLFSLLNFCFGSSMTLFWRSWCWTAKCLSWYPSQRMSTWWG